MSKCFLNALLLQMITHSQFTSLELEAKMLPFFSNSDKSGDGGGVAFWHRSFFWVRSSRSDAWLMSSIESPEDSENVMNLDDPEA